MIQILYEPKRIEYEYLYLVEDGLLNVFSRPKISLNNQRQIEVFTQACDNFESELNKKYETLKLNVLPNCGQAKANLAKVYP